MRHSFVHPIPLPPAGTDGLNRLPRPLKIFGVIGLFVWAVADPPAFLLAMLALQNVPEMLWYIFLAVIGFCFGTKVKQQISQPPWLPVGGVCPRCRLWYDQDGDCADANTSRGARGKGGARGRGVGQFRWRGFASSFTLGARIV